MSGLSRAVSAVGRCIARLVPARRRDWVEAVWSEAHEVPPGLQRWAWRAGGIRVFARGWLLRRSLWSTLLFAAAASFIGWEFWSGSPGGVSAVSVRVYVVSMLLSLAGLVLVARRFLPRSDNRIAKCLRVGTYGGFLILITAEGTIEQFTNRRPNKALPLLIYGVVAKWDSPVAIDLVILLLFVVAIAWFTSHRSRVARSTLAIGVIFGVALGVVMYVVAPLGLSQEATNPWLPGSDIDPFVVVAWILVLLGPCIAGGLAHLRYKEENNPHTSTGDQIRQVVTAGLLANLVGALFVNVLGTATIALMINTSWLRNWLYQGRHLLFGVAGLQPVLRGDPGAIAFSHEITGASDSRALIVVFILFMLIGAIETGALAMFMRANAQMERDNPPRGDGEEPEPEGRPEGPGGAHLAEEAEGEDSPDLGGLIVRALIVREHTPDIEQNRVLVGSCMT